ncbi:acyl-CoA dehydrogenase family protein [Parapedobacter tibetensis]|uniref:acyl-CoA dehydrogenase family protein n=1 Tax=Parapedobacter tibetensis TaxID=2972951 RepID=UPI00214DBE19|nr:acyl-CoA dehydrogenase family protein [Parapedobacter tibetensis]
MLDTLTPPINTNFKSFIKDFEQTLKHLFHERNDIDQLSLRRGLPSSISNEILDKHPLSVAIPKEYGGRGLHVKECLGILASASYESLSLSLIFGINIALFLEPVAKYAKPAVKEAIFKRFIEERGMGGLMITEPDFGSDALNMQTYHKEQEHSYQIKGTKHWQGLTGMADYWLVASRKQLPSGQLDRDLSFFICDTRQEKQQIKVEEYYDNLGLYMIPYGRNELDIEVPKSFKLQPESTGIKMMLDILHRSRLQFPGMGMGFIKRMLDEAITHCKNRTIGASSLFDMDQIQFQLSRIQAAYTLCSAMCARSCTISGIENNLALAGLEANSMKAVVTDMMHESAQILLQVSGAKGYRISHIGGRGTTDSRSFQIFEGSNEMLYGQIAETMYRMMKKEKEQHLFSFLKRHPLTANAVDFFKKETDFQIDTVLPQRKLVDLGKVLARIISIGYVLDLQASGFRNDLIHQCINTVKHEIAGLVRSFEFENTIHVVFDYTDNSSWLEFTV